MEVNIVANESILQIGSKQERDDSFKNNENGESGVFSGNDASAENSWAMEIKGEVLDHSVFDPPINSTAINPGPPENEQRKRRCSISTINYDDSNLCVTDFSKDTG